MYVSNNVQLCTCSHFDAESLRGSLFNGNVSLRHNSRSRFIIVSIFHDWQVNTHCVCLSFKRITCHFLSLKVLPFFWSSFFTLFYNRSKSAIVCSTMATMKTLSSSREASTCRWVSESCSRGRSTREHIVTLIMTRENEQFLIIPTNDSQKLIAIQYFNNTRSMHVVNILPFLLPFIVLVQCASFVSRYTLRSLVTCIDV